MALRALMLKKKLDDLHARLDAAKEQAEALKKREADLETAINEAETEEEQQTVSDAVKEFEDDKKENEQEEQSLLSAIEETEAELAEIEKNETESRNSDPQEQAEKQPERRNKVMPYQHESFFGMPEERKAAFFANEEVRTFLADVRETGGKQKRAISGVELLIPDVMLPLIRQKAEEFSKLLKYVNFRAVKGKARITIAGATPEAAWTEMYTGVSEELALAFCADKFDGYKVSGYVAISNDYLVDSDIALATEIINAVSAAIGKALDKAILYGADGEMAYGVVPSLLATTAPSNHPTSGGRTWEDFHSSHVVTITSANATGVKLFQNIVLNTALIRNDYSDGGLVWVMNSATKTKILAESVGVNSGAAVVAGMGNTMPVVGGDIVTLEYIPDSTVIFGYFNNYMLVQREGVELAQSTDVRFLEDETVYRGTARYDGKPIIREAFAVLGVGKAPTTTSPEFAGESSETEGDSEGSGS